MFKHTRMFMVTKTITVTEDAYKKLASNKKQGESFSELINRSFVKKGNAEELMKFAGAWKHIPDKEIEDMKKSIEGLRKRSSKRLLERIKGM